jgi:thiol-disulfide isomerase/thioredoxin
MEKPPIFESLELAEAMQRAAAAGRWLLVDATAAWCPPCKQMDRNTWRDGAVVAWVDGHALAVQVDVDVEEELAAKLEIRSMPTVIAFRDGTEQDRISGYRSPAGLLAWLQGLERGETALDQLRRAVADPERDMHGRLNVAQALLRGGRYDEATDELAWLWGNIARVEPGMDGVRVSFMAGDIEQLVGEHPPARDRFTEIRDRTTALADAGAAAALQARLDWMVLNEILGDPDRTAHWFDGVKDDPEYAPLLEQVAHRLIPLLRARDRLEDIGRLYKDPVAHLVRNHQMTQPPSGVAAGPEVPEGVPADVLDKIRGMLAQRFREDAALLLASLRAAGRDTDASAVEREALRLDTSAEMVTALRDAVSGHN